MRVKKSARAKTPTAAKAPAVKASRVRSRLKFTKTVVVGLSLVAIAIVAAIVMFTGRDSAERAEAAAVAAQPDSPAVQPQPAKPVRVVPGKKTAAKPRASEAPGAPVAPKTAADLPDAVMLEGCLEQNGEGFRLKNTTGEDAPKSRSWKSGFLKKGSRPVDIVDWNNRLKDHVGERIAVSGMFVDGEMHVRKLRRVSASCD